VINDIIATLLGATLDVPINAVDGSIFYETDTNISDVTRPSSEAITSYNAEKSDQDHQVKQLPHDYCRNREYTMVAVVSKTLGDMTVLISTNFGNMNVTDEATNRR
jgi:ACT domain-containing protein